MAIIYLLRRGIADKPKAPRLASRILHDFCGGNGAVGSEFGSQLVIVHTVIKILDVQVHALVLGNFFLTCLIESAEIWTFPTYALSEEKCCRANCKEVYLLY